MTLDLMRRVTVAADPELSKGYPTQRAAHVEIELADGRVLKHFQPSRKGDPDMPLSDEEVNEKYTELAVPAIGAAAATELLEKLWSLERQPDLTFSRTAAKAAA